MTASFFLTSSLWASASENFSHETDDKNSKVMQVDRLCKDIEQLSLSPDEKLFGRSHFVYSTVVNRTDLEVLSQLLKRNGYEPHYLEKIYYAVLSYNQKKKRAAAMKPFQIESLKEAFIHLSGMIKNAYNAELDQFMIKKGAFNPFTGSKKKCDMGPLRQLYVNPYQRLCNGVIEILERAKAMPNTQLPYGQITVKGSNFGAFYCQDEGGYLAHNYCVHGPVAVSDVMGELVEGVHQRMFIFEDGQHIEDWGLAVSFKNDSMGCTVLNVVPVRGGNADLPFTLSRIIKTVVYSSSEDITRTSFGSFLSLAVGSDFFERKKSGFIKIPTESIESEVTELLVLESLLADAQHDDHSVRQKAISYISAIEQSSAATVGEMIAELEVKIKMNIEDELSENSHIPPAPVSSSSARQNTTLPTKAAVHKKAKRKSNIGKAKGKGKKFVQDCKEKDVDKDVMGARATPPITREEKVRELFEEFKVKTRTKYREYLTVQRNILRKFPEHVVKNALSHVSVKGSHFNIHATTGKGLTNVKKHGTGDTSVPPSRINKFSQELIQVLVNSMDDAALGMLE